MTVLPSTNYYTPYSTCQLGNQLHGSHTKQVLGAELSQTAELEVEIDDGNTSCYCENNHIGALCVL